MNTLTRILFDIAIIVFLVFGLWYFAIVLALIGLFRFKNYFEFVLFGLLYDSLFRINGIEGIAQYWVTIFVSIVFLSYHFMKGAIRK